MAMQSCSRGLSCHLFQGRSRLRLAATRPAIGQFATGLTKVTMAVGQRQRFPLLLLALQIRLPQPVHAEGRSDSAWRRSSDRRALACATVQIRSGPALSTRNLHDNAQYGPSWNTSSLRQDGISWLPSDQTRSVPRIHRRTRRIANRPRPLLPIRPDHLAQGNPAGMQVGMLRKCQTAPKPGVDCLRLGEWVRPRICRFDPSSARLARPL